MKSTTLKYKYRAIDGTHVSDEDEEYGASKAQCIKSLRNSFLHSTTPLIEIEGVPEPSFLTFLETELANAEEGVKEAKAHLNRVKREIKGVIL